MEILTALGINSTIWFQFGCFLIAFLAVSQLVFKPYLAAFHERTRRTSGQEESAEKVLIEVTDLRSQYESRAREVNAQYKAIYDKTRTEAMREHDRLVSAARESAAKHIEENRLKIEAEMERARRDVTEQVPVLGVVIANRLIGKDTSP